MLTHTKRNVLEISSSIYDPMCLIQAILKGLKILTQNICKEKLDWDEMLSPKLLRNWHDCLAKLKKLGSIEIHSHFETGNNTNLVAKRKLHGFSDASLNDHGLVIMLKLSINQGKFQSNYHRQNLE